MLQSTIYFLFPNIIKIYLLYSGWIDQSLFYQLFEQVFVQQTKDLPRPLLLILDGYGSHFSVETLRFAVQNNM